MSALRDDPWMGYYVITIAAALDLVVALRGLPPNVDGQLVTGVILTAWNGMAAIVVNYRYGSTSQSARQAELLAAAAPAASPSVADVAAKTENNAEDRRNSRP